MNTERPSRLAHQIPIERTYAPDRDAQLAALRVVLGLPRRITGEVRVQP
jgi:hypothetical protein